MGTSTVANPQADVTVGTNPLLEGLEVDRVTDPCTIVFFGASGDLFTRMLMPAMYNLRLGGILPENFGIIGFSRSVYTDEEFREMSRKSISDFSRSGPAHETLWNEFSSHMRYVGGEFDDIETFRQLQRVLNESDEKLGTKSNRLFYLSTPPGVFADIVRQLDTVGLGPRENPKGWTRIIIEKPFGTSLETARALQAEVGRVFEERQIYRIDHYLGKEPVQDIMALRFANVIFEPIWNRQYVDSIQITAAETVGVEKRGGYYETSGALRDMIQNHVINLLALVAMEPPVRSDADSIRDEKFKVLTAMRPITEELVNEHAARGQYTEGAYDADRLPGYRQEPGVNPQSNTDTFAAVKFYIDNWRWAEVPFYVRSGKRLGRKCSEIAVTFKPIPHRLFGEAGDNIAQNTLVIKIQPDEGVSITFAAKVPGPKMHIRPVNMDFNYGSGFGVVSAPAYERLIGDAMRGDATLFTRWDAVEVAWQRVMPIIDKWAKSSLEPADGYAVGSQGPQSAANLLAADGREWRQI